jgi:NADH-quinone oxidoreductase subunit H
MVTVSALATTLFLGGWRAPVPISLWHGANSGWWPILWFTAKVILGIFVFVWLRGTLPRLRYDQFMQLGWKVLIPVNLVWILAVTAIHVFRDRNWPAWEATALPLGVVLVLVVLPGVMIWEGARARREADLLDEEDDEAALPTTFPLPPLNLVVPKSPRELARTNARVSVGAGKPAGAKGTGGTEPAGQLTGSSTEDESDE